MPLIRPRGTGPGRPQEDVLSFLNPCCTGRLLCTPGTTLDPDLPFRLPRRAFFYFWASRPGKSGGVLLLPGHAALALTGLASAGREEGLGPGTGPQREAVGPPPLEHHIELGDQKVDVVALLGLEGLSNDARGLPVLLAPKRQPIHLQDHVAHLELPTVVGRTAALHGQNTGQGHTRHLRARLATIWVSAGPMRETGAP